MSAPGRGRLPVPGNPAAMLGPDLLAERSSPCGARARSKIVEEAREPPPAGPRIPGEPRARERERRRRTYRVRDDARGPDRSGTRRLRAGSLNRNATVPHAGTTPPVLSPRSPTSRSLASSEGSSPYEPGQPGRGRQRRDHQRRPTSLGRRATNHRIFSEGGDGAAAPSSDGAGTSTGTGAPRRRRSRGGRGRSRSGSGTGGSWRRWHQDPGRIAGQPIGNLPVRRVTTARHRRLVLGPHVRRLRARPPRPTRPPSPIDPNERLDPTGSSDDHGRSRIARRRRHP